MKKLIALIAVLALCLTAIPVLAEDANADLLSAKAYIYQMYKNPSRTDIKSTPVDFDVIGSVPVDGVEYTVEWSADSDTIKVIVNEDGSVTIDVDENNPSELFYKLTATVKDAAGNTASVSFDRKVPASLTGMTYEQIVDYAYTLVDGEKSAKAYRLYGTVIKIPTEWSEQYGNITVDIAIAGKEDMPIECYRLKGEGAKDLKIGDQITVEGYFKNYKGLIEFDAGCTLVGYGEIISQQPILDAAYQLLDGEKMAAPTALKGQIFKITSEWSEQYGNITVDMYVDGNEEMPIECYRLKGEGAKDLKVGDEIAVFGTIKNYKGLIEFDQGCVLIPVGTENEVRTLAAAYQLLDGEAMTSVNTLTGVISSIDTAYSEEYKNITVTIVVAGLEDYKVQCYRLAGEGAAELAVGDTITVTGTIKNYKGTIEFDKGCTLDAVVK
ncbi:MAG: hypothetical protein E7322_06425 [Clostridiales bacterium]|nr:hypothetical protein [Clostridiales bacterium]